MRIFDNLINNSRNHSSISRKSHFPYQEIKKMTIITKFEVEKEPKRFPKFRIVIGGAFIIMLVVAEIWVSHALVIQGAQVAQMENIQKRIASENQLLESEIAKDSSLSKIASSAATLGLERPKDIQYIR